MTAAFKGRREDKRLVTGQGKYTSDWNLPGQVYAAFLRSDRAHAEVLSVDLSAAREMPGVIAILTAPDLAEAGILVPPQRVPLTGRNGKPPFKPEQQLLARDKVVFVGHPVALVIAETQMQAEDAAEQIMVDYRDLPPIINVPDAIAAGAALLYPDVPNNIAFDYEFGDEAATRKAFDSAAHVVKVTLDNTRIVVNPMEPKACLVQWHADTGIYDVYMPMQGTNFALKGFQSYFNEPREKFRVIAKDLGGSFGTRGGPYAENIALVVAARKVGRPIKWVATRSETFLSDYHGRSVIQIGELAFDKDGIFLAIRHDWQIDVGNYPGDFGGLPIARNCFNAGIGPYRIPAIYAHFLLCVTNKVALGAYRGAGRPETSMMVEQLVDAAALKLGLDAFEIRRRNVIKREEYPYATPHGPVYDTGDHLHLMEVAESESDWKSFPARRQEAASRGKLRGIGCCAVNEQSGTAIPEPDQTAIRFSADGKVELYSIAGPSGQGTESIFAMIVARELGVSDDNIVVKISDPDGPALTGLGTGGSRAAQVYGTTYTLGSREAVKKGLALASGDLEAAEADIEFRDGAYSVAGTDLKVGLLDLAKKHLGALDTLTTFAPKPSFPGGAHVVEVEIDPDTGVLEIVRYVASDDFGVLIDHTMADGQLIGGVVQGIGQVLGEYAIYDKDGQLVTGSFMDYFMPRSDTLKQIEIFDNPVPTPNNVLGAKGVGEAGAAGALTTTYSAIMDALRQVGVRQMDMPFTPLRIWEAIQKAKQA